MYWAGSSMNNLSSNCGLVDEKIRASDKDLHQTLDFYEDCLLEATLGIGGLHLKIPFL